LKHRIAIDGPRRWIGRAACLLCFAALSACGFTPLYAVPGVAPGLSAIATDISHGRTAYLLREDLDDAFGRNNSIPAAYRLKIVVEERRLARGLRVDNVANRYELQLKVTYTLTQAQTRAVLLSGMVPIAVTYDSADAPYGGISAQMDGQKRAASEAAQQIRLEVACYFAGLKAS
jgi:LPS-assembly lipoprotein